MSLMVFFYFFLILPLMRGIVSLKFFRCDARDCPFCFGSFGKQRAVCVIIRQSSPLMSRTVACSFNFSVDELVEKLIWPLVSVEILNSRSIP